MRRMMTISLVLSGTGAHAHAGHPELLGLHEPWMIGAGIGAVILAGLLGKKKAKEDAEAEAEAESEGDPA